MSTLAVVPCVLSEADWLTPDQQVRLAVASVGHRDRAAARGRPGHRHHVRRGPDVRRPRPRRLLTARGGGLAAKFEHAI